MGVTDSFDILDPFVLNLLGLLVFTGMTSSSLSSMEAESEREPDKKKSERNANLAFFYFTAKN